MPPTIVLGSIFITLALICYAIGVWSGRIAGRLKAWHVIFFWLGLICDTTGTVIMTRYAGGLGASVHGVTGIIAILLMAANAVWATIVLMRKNEREIVSFPRFSLVVWVTWLIPYLSGFLMGMRR